MKLLINALIKFLIGLLAIAGLIFVPAGTIKYWEAWLFLSVLALPMAILIIVLLITRPALLESRLEIKERLERQNVLIGFSVIMFIASFTFAGINHRYGWYSLPNWAILTAACVFVVAYVAYANVMCANQYLSRTIKVAKNQKVISTGPYSIVRHPMYSITVILFLLAPIILNSPISIIISLAYPFMIANRIKDEEAFLEKKLTGYKAYEQKVKWRLIPYVW